jgi:cellulose/xylan binding protein with CBM9 domain/GDSL-like lipase/acylhydrolase family protein
MFVHRLVLMIAAVALMISGCASSDSSGPVANAATAATSVKAAPAVRGEARATMVEKGPALDGTLNDPAWQKAAPLVLGDGRTKKSAAVATVARLLWSPTHLYLGVECAEPKTDQIVAPATERDGAAYMGDGIELFVTGDRREKWYQFVVNAKGTLFDATFKGTGSHTAVDKKWNSTAVAKAAVQKNKSWTLTLAIPLKEISCFVGKNQTWVLNICRNRSGRDGGKNSNMSWSVLPGLDYHEVKNFGRVDGVSVAERADGVTRKIAPPPPPPKFLKGEVRGDVTVYKTWDAVTIPNTPGKGTAKNLPLGLRGSANLKVAFVARGVGKSVTQARFNLYDIVARNNTSSSADRTVDGKWRTIVYHVKDFLYNGTRNKVKADTQFRSIFFHGNRSDDANAKLELRNLVVYRGDDRTPPEAPTGLKAKGSTLTWQPAKDNAGVARYVISREIAGGKFKKEGEATEPLYKVFVGGRYRVLAVDFENNVGPWSDVLTVKQTVSKLLVVTQLERDRIGYAANIRKIHAAGAGKVVRGRVFFFGDSLTHATIYPRAGHAALGQFEMRSTGHSGIRTGAALKKLDGHLAKHNPEFCLILLGTNNGKNARGIAGGMKDLMAMADKCKARGTVAVFMTIPPRGFKAESPGEKAYNDALIKTCRDNGYPVAYSFEPLMKADRKAVLQRDGVHFKGPGVNICAKAWQAVMDQVLFAILDRP